MIGTAPLSIHEIDVHDDDELRRWWEAESESQRAGRPEASVKPYAAVAAAWRNRAKHYRVVPLAATREGEVVGTAELHLPLLDNLHFSELTICVRPEHRRQGIGTELHGFAARLQREAGRTTSYGETYALADGSSASGPEFARAMGYSVVNTEDHLCAPLPLPAEAESWEEVGDGHELVTWTDHCPDDLIEAYCRMRNQMAGEVPTGDTDVEPVMTSPERVREGEARLARSYVTFVAAARRVLDGELCGYSVLYLPRGERRALQDDTLVMPSDRGHGLGLAMKARTAAMLGAAHPEVDSVETWTSPDNTAMQRTNARFGYRLADRMYGVQRVEDSAAV